MRPLTVVGFILMFLGPLVVLLRSFGVILVDDVCTLGTMVLLFGWGIYMYSELDEKIARLEKKAQDELNMHMGQKDGEDRLKQSLQRDVLDALRVELKRNEVLRNKLQTKRVQNEVTTIGFGLCDILTHIGKEDVGGGVC